MKILKFRFIIFISIIILVQITLISHRNSFSFHYLFKFYQNEIGIKNGIKNKKILDIISLIKKNNLSEFRISNELLTDNVHKQSKIHQKIFQRVIEGSYPSKYSKDSKFVISDTNNLNCKKKDQLNQIYLYECI
ncbi:hypothetical protein N9X21_04845 [Candidatus Pelagibacter bacterium]|jgi:hypothetical protein|nr:hypothetical protein [Candidatus Pelagibacter bacterium]|tara:strand:- start:1606 stop:2007 length:402 start_codon:yes stop_codon:yes gene_type:complete